MAEQEGVIKYELVFDDAPSLEDHNYTALSYWHGQFKQASILGQDPQRYGGLGFGNLSERIDQTSFLISGTQTGGLDRLGADEYALVTRVDIVANRVEAQGRVRPSSEALTHAAVYALDDRIQFVFHVHSPDLWQASSQLCMAQTSAGIEYGTPAMADEMKRLRDVGSFHAGNLLAMTGHEDGIISFGATAEEAGDLITQALHKLKQ